MRVPAGKMCQTLVASSTTSRSPSTKSGIEASTRLVPDDAESNALSRRAAAYEPMTIDSGIEIAALTAMRNSEFHSRSPSTSITGSPLVNDVPGSPVTSR